MSANAHQFLKMPDSLWQNIYWHHNGVDSRKYSGSVLYIGMGSCFLPRTQSSLVVKTVIVEIDPSVISYNLTENNLCSTWTVVQYDAWQYQPEDLFDIIVVDIWYGQESRQTVTTLCDRYRPYLAPNGKIDYLSTVILG